MDGLTQDMNEMNDLGCITPGSEVEIPKGAVWLACDGLYFAGVRSDQDYLNRMMNNEIELMDARYHNAMNAGLRAPAGIENSAEAKRWDEYHAASRPQPKPFSWWDRIVRFFFDA